MRISKEGTDAAKARIGFGTSCACEIAFNAIFRNESQQSRPVYPRLFRPTPKGGQLFDQVSWDAYAENSIRLGEQIRLLE